MSEQLSEEPIIEVPNWLPSRPIKKKKAKRVLPRIITINDFKAMRKVAHLVYPPKEDKTSIRNRLMLDIMFFTGARCNEVRTLRIENVDFINKRIKLFGKDSKERFVPMFPFLAEELKQFIGNIRKDGYLFGGDFEEDLISLRMMRYLIKAIAKEANIQNWQEVHPHTLRHAFGTYLRNKGADLDEIRMLLGHENIETTLIYAHLATDSLFAKVNKIFLEDIVNL
jgi:site-specific recombinase XerD